MPSSSLAAPGLRVSWGSVLWGSGAIGCGEVKGNGSSDGADIREPEEPRAFYRRFAFLKVWAGNPRHRNQLELTLKYRLLFPIRDLLNPNLEWGARTCSLHKHVHDS